jgi:hypothetical protein
LTIATIQHGQHLVFQNVIRNEDYAETSLLPLDSPGAMRVTTGLVCERVHFAAGSGVCLAAQHDVESSYRAIVFDAAFAPRGEIELPGAPTLARVSPDGRLAAASFQTSPPTAEMPFPPTETWLLDTATAEVVADLADFSVLRDGTPVVATEMDSWGVTFASDGEHFYVTVRFDGNIHLAHGSVSGERLNVLQSGVSAPSLSPDQRRIAFARLISNIGPIWRFHVLDLENGSQTALSEATSIDDQMEWMNNDYLLYGLATDIWTVPANGGGTPIPFLFGGLSPAVANAL